MSTNNKEIKILILITCENEKFKHRYSEAIKEWLYISSELTENKPVLKFSEINILNVEIPEIKEVKKYNGVIITGSFSRISQNKEWMKRLREKIVEFYLNEVPVLGICFGFQIIAQTFGSEVGASPYGFNFGAFEHQLEQKVQPFFKKYLEDFEREKKVGKIKLNGSNEPTNLNHNHVNENPQKSMVAVFSHNDVVMTMPDIEKMKFEEIREKNMEETKDNLKKLVAIKISSTEKVPFIGMLMGNQSKLFMIAVQVHPEFDSPDGHKFFTEIMSEKIKQGRISLEEFKNSMLDYDKSNSGYVYGRMVLDLFTNSQILPG